MKYLKGFNESKKDTFVRSFVIGEVMREINKSIHLDDIGESITDQITDLEDSMENISIINQDKYGDKLIYSIFTLKAKDRTENMKSIFNNDEVGTNLYTTNYLDKNQEYANSVSHDVELIDLLDVMNNKEQNNETYLMISSYLTINDKMISNIKVKEDYDGSHYLQYSSLGNLCSNSDISNNMKLIPNEFIDRCKQIKSDLNYEWDVYIDLDDKMVNLSFVFIINNTYDGYVSLLNTKLTQIKDEDIRIKLKDFIESRLNHKDSIDLLNILCP